MREKFQGYGIEPNPEPEVLWNFEKFVIGRDGDVVARFAPDTAPDDPALVAAIETGARGLSVAGTDPPLAFAYQSCPRAAAVGLRCHHGSWSCSSRTSSSRRSGAMWRP